MVWKISCGSIISNLIRLLVILSVVAQVTPRQCLNNLKEERTKKSFEVNNEILNLTLETSSTRIGHQLVTNIFAIFLRDILAYDNVQIVTKADYYSENSSALILQRLIALDLRQSNLGQERTSETMINLGVWLYSQLEMEKFESPDAFQKCGYLGFRGRYGWFIPKTKVIEDNPSVDYWRTFQNDKSVIKLFTLEQLDYYNATENHAKNRRTGRYYCEESYCQNGVFTPAVCKRNTGPAHSRCAVLLAAHINSSSFLAEQISNLSLQVQVIWLGSNLEPFVRYLHDKYQDAEMEGRSKSKGILFFSWAPTILTTRMGDLISVTFPPCNSNDSFCRYESKYLHKIVSPWVQKGAKPAFEAVHRFSLTYNEYDSLLQLYLDEEDDRENTIGGRLKAPDVNSVACKWMTRNEIVWRNWTPRGEKGKLTLVIGAIFPISGSYTAKGIVIGAEMAVNAINKNIGVLKDYRLKMLVQDGQCKADKVMKSFIDYIRLPEFPHMAGILGPACSDTAEPLAGVAKHFKTVVISYSAEGSSFSDREKYPYFYRTIGENKQFQHVYLALFQRLKWVRLASLTEDGQKYAEYLSHLHDLLQEHKISFIANRKFPKDRPALNMSQYLQDLKIRKARIIIGDFYDNTARAVMCEAYHQKMTAKEGFVWFLPIWFLKDWYDTDKHNNGSDSDPIPCNTSQMIQAIDGHFSLQYAYFAPEDQVMQDNKTVGEWKDVYEKNCKFRNVSTSDYAGYAYDALWTYAYALDKLLKNNHSHITNLHSDKTTATFVKLINETDFHGVSGHIRFGGGASRLSIIHVVQWVDREANIVGSFYPKTTNVSNEIIGGRLELNDSAIKWFTPDGSIPTDGSEPPPQCFLETLATALDVTCEVAIVIVNVIGFGILGFCLVICFVILKRRYERKVKATKEYLKQFGIDIKESMFPTALDKWEIPRDRIVLNRKLGEGAFGTVYGGECFFDEKGWVSVAVKSLKMGSTSEQKVEFLSEAEVMKRFDHKNIVKLLAVCTQEEPVHTVMEYMLHGDLKTYLLARRNLANFNERNCDESDEISSKRLTSMAIDVARALSYLAELKYVHRDVACRNCLVNANRVVKLGDFGMTRPMYENDYYRFHRKGMLPVRWMAPESLADGIFTPMSDVWSYGVLLYEIVTFGNFPFQGKSNSEVLEYVKAGNTVRVPTGVKPQLEKLLKLCWTYDHHKRPPAAEIVEFLANNPRLISPCIDMPMASVQMEGKDQLELSMRERPNTRKASYLHKNGASNSMRSNILPYKFGSSMNQPGLSREPMVSTPKDFSKKNSVTINDEEEKIPLTGQRLNNTHMDNSNSFQNIPYVSIQKSANDSFDETVY